MTIDDRFRRQMEKVLRQIEASSKKQQVTNESLEQTRAAKKNERSSSSGSDRGSFSSILEETIHNQIELVNSRQKQRKNSALSSTGSTNNDTVSITNQEMGDNQNQNCGAVAMETEECEYTCASCPSTAITTYSSQSAYITHLFIAHTDFSVVDTESYAMDRRSVFPYKKADDKYTCDTCKYTCTLRDAFVEHVRCHLVVKPYSCGTCVESFKSPKEFVQHIDGE